MTGTDNYDSGEVCFVNLNVEICCEVCNEAVHFHLEQCPCCKKEDAETDYPGNPRDCIEEGGFFICGNCRQKFVLHSYDYFNQPQAVVQIVK